MTLGNMNGLPILIRNVLEDGVLLELVNSSYGHIPKIFDPMKPAVALAVNQKTFDALKKQFEKGEGRVD